MNYVVIKEKNICNRKININNSSKGSNHGYGIKIIKDIVKKYSGDIEINIKDKEFEIVIMFER